VQLKSQGYSILLVDDNPDHLKFQELSIRKLENVDSIKTAGDTDEALEILIENKVDLIILDYNLPGKDGLVFMESLVASNFDVPVIMVTGLGNEKIAVKAMKLGAFDYIVKDKDYMKNLPAVISRTLDKLHLSQALKKAREQLKETEERYQKLYENANTGFVSVDLKSGKLIEPNRKLMEMTKLSRHSLSEMFLYDLAAPDDRDRILKYHQHRMAGKWEEPDTPASFDFWLNSMDDVNTYVNCTVTMLPQIDEMFITLIDITDRKILEEELHIANEKLQQANKKLQKQATELASKVDELQKLVIEPTLENFTPTEQRYDMDCGNTYLIKENNPTKVTMYSGISFLTASLDSSLQEHIPQEYKNYIIWKKHR
jgi:PAS domain S-box-containing protein